MLGIIYPDVASAQADQTKIAMAFGWPRCARLTGVVIGAVPECACTTGIGPGVHATCPYATRRQTDIVTDSLARPCLVVDAATQGLPAAVAAVPAVATAIVITLATPALDAIVEGVADAEVG
jgi:hypothetical protein